MDARLISEIDTAASRAAVRAAGYGWTGEDRLRTAALAAAAAGRAAARAFEAFAVAEREARS